MPKIHTMNKSLSIFFNFVTVCIAITSIIFMSGCLNEDNLIGENCYDGILNNGEELIDCGGQFAIHVIHVKTDLGSTTWRAVG